MPRRRLMLATLLLCAALTGAPAQAACLAYGRPLAGLAGKLEVRDFFGPPGYGENPGTDRRERQAVLVLDEPVCADAGALAGEVAEVGQRELTLTPGGAGIGFTAWAGRRVVVGGELFHAFTAHHHTPLLVRVTHIAQAAR
ncbi:DUF4431 domain-containing protein [Roseateles sp. BYS96W]|uniref:DUF4431 domain-containing protein n=1 Tax=Pelomonas nitida TaxID=3299027 RepID=A0ABW7GCK5_9BURK